MPDEAEISATFIAVIQKYTDFLTFFNTFNILTPKLCVQRITDRECQKTTDKNIRPAFCISYALWLRDILLQFLSYFLSVISNSEKTSVFSSAITDL